jgi:hypothetical protein
LLTSGLIPEVTDAYQAFRSARSPGITTIHQATYLKVRFRLPFGGVRLAVSAETLLVTSMGTGPKNTGTTKFILPAAIRP